MYFIYHSWFSPVSILVQISPGSLCRQTEAVGGILGLFHYKWVFVWVQVHVTSMPFLLIGSVWHTFLLNSNPPVCWTLWVVFSSVLFILGSCPGLHHHGSICTEGSWVLQIQVWIKVIRSCKALFTNNAVTLIIECLPTWALNYKSSFLLPSSFASIVV